MKVLVLTVVLFATIPAKAGTRLELEDSGSVTLQELQQAFRAETKLQETIAQALAKQSLPADKIGCVGARFGFRWSHLGGARAVPFYCDIGERRLVIEGDIILLDKRGCPVRPGSKRAKQRAVDFRQVHINWRWQQPTDER